MTISAVGVVGVTAAILAALLVLKSIRALATVLLINIVAQVSASTLLRGDWKLLAKQLSPSFAWDHLTSVDIIGVLIGGLAALSMFGRVR